MFEDILQQALRELTTCMSRDQLHDFHSKYLGKQGVVNQQYKTLKDLSPEDKKAAGPAIQALQQQIETAFFEQQERVKEQLREESMRQERIDRSTPVS